MDDNKQAYRVLGIPEDATKEQVENRYFILVKQHKRAVQEGGDTAAAEAAFDEVNKAYRLLMGLEKQKANASFNEKAYSSSARREKIDHFFHYYKYHVLGAIVLVVAIVYIVIGIVDKQQERAALAKLPPLNLEMTLMGDYQSDETAKLENNLLQTFPDWQRVKVSTIYFPEQAKNEFDVAMQQKSMISLMEIKPDLYLVDKANFSKLLNQGAYFPMDELESVVKALPEDKIYKGKGPDDTSEHIYGIDVTGSSLFDGVRIAGSKEKIAVLRFDTKRKENAYRMIEWFVQHAG
ncbi:J domain-containing protein [Paenibacillus cymbidii]|uniref:J domain-containing protein n=1 Tax=Paenibacillus cymbidii TaxID=1639034 RepID=UPI001080EC85|nr:DnaJ domain-containing protein [Paenibacillus cymbidii]